MSPQEELRHYRALAIALNEGPDGTNRLRAEILQRQLQQQRPQSRGTTGAFLAGTIGSLLMMAGGLSVGIQLAQQGKLDQLIATADRIQQAARPQQTSPHSTHSRSAPARHPSAPVATTPLWRQPQVPDPAGAMQSRFFAATWGGDFSALDAGMDHYRKLSGTLARIQAVALRNRSAAHRLPTVFINRTNNCFSRPSIGMFSPRCEVIKIDYRDHQLAYEYPVEIEVVLAHEWGHHLIHLSGERMSPIEEEVVCDCTAGMVFGYYAKHGLINQDEAIKAFRLIADVGNNSAHGHHPNAEVRLTAFLGGLMSIAAPHEPQAQDSIAFCSSLKRVLDLQKVQTMGLTWSA
jgi:hypothetical protein